MSPAVVKAMRQLLGKLTSKSGFSDGTVLGSAACCCFATTSALILTTALQKVLLVTCLQGTEVRRAARSWWLCCEYSTAGAEQGDLSDL